MVWADLLYHVGFGQSSGSYHFYAPKDQQISGLPATTLKLRTGVVDSIATSMVVFQDAKFAKIGKDSPQGTITVQPGQQS